MTIRPWTHLHATRHRYRILVLVSVPERVIVSACEKLRSAKLLKVRSKVANGLGSPTLFVLSLARAKCEVRESRLPKTTGQPLPPSKTTESRAAIVTISAQETVCGQTVSSVSLIASSTSRPRMELLLGPASCSE
jgi:hypothetical protein